MGQQLQSRRWHGGIGTGKSSALRHAVSQAIEAGLRPIAWLPAMSDIGLRTERIQFPDNEIAARLGAEVFVGRLVRNLSSGERQRVRLALALTAAVRFAALDEPCRHLDPEHVEALNDILLEQAAAGMTVAASDIRRQLARDLFMDEVGEVLEVPRPAACGSAQGDPLALDIAIPFLLSNAGKPTGKQRIEVERGSLIVVRGTNGSGKTSLLEALSRAARSSGTVCGFSRQEPEHQVFASTPRAELDEVSSLHDSASWAGDELLESLRLCAWMTMPTPRLPLGVLCLLGAAIALRMGRELVLLDEPTQGLDTSSARNLAAELVRCAQAGARIVVASHDPELERVANRTWSVEHGSLTLGQTA